MAQIDVREVLRDLPLDPYDALLTASERLAAAFEAQMDVGEEDYEIACRMLMKLASRLSDLKLEGINNRPWSDDFAMFQGQIRTRQRRARMDEAVDDELSLRDDRENKFGIATLTEADKSLIHEKIASIRESIGASALSQKKKNALYARLADLAKEVDAIGTRTDRFFALIGDFAFVFRDMHERARPAIEDAKEILEIVVRRRAEEEQVELPAPEEFPSLPKPQKSEGDTH